MNMTIDDSYTLAETLVLGFFKNIIQPVVPKEDHQLLFILTEKIQQNFDIWACTHKVPSGDCDVNSAIVSILLKISMRVHRELMASKKEAEIAQELDMQVLATKELQKRMASGERGIMLTKRQTCALIQRAKEIGCDILSQPLQ
jgi:hypothetical protein